MQLRSPAVAGSFYPDDPETLRESVAACLRAAEQRLGPARKGEQPRLPKALIVPHAGYEFSGPVAGSAYARLASARGVVTRVVLAGPAHYVPVDGVAVSGADGFVTPLGVVPVDKDAAKRLLALRQVRIADEPHAPEHCLETQLPFLQYVLAPPASKRKRPAAGGTDGHAPQAGFSIVPLIVGETTTEEMAEVLEALWGGPETLLVISADLSHFHDYETAQRLDAAA
ncbi:MAG: AmmeMemoRadiSam system protein B, partial [Planctomycetota bacterium]|nr:AmmeMemoRadiSam system protein B [Planctomycetota bacterium]